MRKASLIALSLLACLVCLMGPAQAMAASDAPPCFFFTENGHMIGKLHCNAKANDLETVFTQKPGTACSVQLTVNGAPDGAPIPCPPNANDIEVTWGLNPAGQEVIMKCVWTVNGVAIASCLPTNHNPLDNGFTLVSLTIVRAFWTLNGKMIGLPIKAPTGANDLEFKA